jgi:hypothetical protein
MMTGRKDVGYRGEKIIKKRTGNEDERMSKR